MSKLIDINALNKNNDYINNNINTRLIDNASKNLLQIDIEEIKKIIISAGIGGVTSWDGNAYTHNGITYTFNNGIVIANGTNTTGFNSGCFLPFNLKAGNYKLSGLPATGYYNSYWFNIFRTNKNYFFQENDFIIESDTQAVLVIWVAPGYTVDNVVFYPMIRRAEIIDNTFEPYYRSQKQLDSDLTMTENKISKLPIGEKSVDFTNVISVNNAINVNAKSVKVKLEPTQDLHGYDKPWAGGQGKNLLPYLINECGWDINVDGTTTTLNNNELIVHCTSAGGSGVFSRFTQNGGKLMSIIADNKPCYVSVDVVADIPVVIALGNEVPVAQQFTISPTKQRINILYDNSNNNTFVCYNFSGEPVNVTLSNLMVSKTEETEYEPYANICDISGYNSVDITQKDTTTNPTVINTYTVNLNNTYCGGELDVTNGIFTFNRGYKLLTNTSQVDDVILNVKGTLVLSFDYAMRPYPNNVNPNDITPKALISNILPTYSGDFAWINNVTSIATNDTGDIVIQVKDITTESEMNTFLAENPIQICYELPTPQTIQLTPTQIQMLLNNNVLYCEDGDISLVYYINDAIGECQKKIENLENDMVSISYSSLVTLKTNENLKPGCFYCITDYVTTTTQDDTQSAGHIFDVIVRADSTNTLNENAYAIQHSGDTYFTGQKLNSWKLKYDINNDTNKYAWADSTNGKGVIYEMEDEYGNKCAYDFKNIQFKRYKITATTTTATDLVDTYSASKRVGSNGLIPSSGFTIDNSDSVWRYTFDYNGNDYSLNKYNSNKVYCYDNTISACHGDCYSAVSNKIYLNSIVFENSLATANNYGNKCGNRNFNNSFGNNCYSNAFGNDYNYNIFGNDCLFNQFGNHCYSNVFGDRHISNSFGNNFSQNKFGNSYDFNSFGNSCMSNSFKNGLAYNSFGNNCYDNRVGNNCYSNSFGDSCKNNSFGDGCCRYVNINFSGKAIKIGFDGDSDYGFIDSGDIENEPDIGDPKAYVYGTIYNNYDVSKTVHMVIDFTYTLESDTGVSHEATVTKDFTVPANDNLDFEIAITEGEDTFNDFKVTGTASFTVGSTTIVSGGYYVY